LNGAWGASAGVRALNWGITTAVGCKKTGHMGTGNIDFAPKHSRREARGRGVDEWWLSFVFTFEW